MFPCPMAGKPHLNHPLQHIFASLFLVAEVGFLLRHEDTVATVKLDVCPPASVASSTCIAETRLLESGWGDLESPGGVALCTDADGFQDSAGTQLLHHPPGVVSHKSIKTQ